MPTRSGISFSVPRNVDLILHAEFNDNIVRTRKPGLSLISGEVHSASM